MTLDLWYNGRDEECFSQAIFTWIEKNEIRSSVNYLRLRNESYKIKKSIFFIILLTALFGALFLYHQSPVEEERFASGNAVSVEKLSFEQLEDEKLVFVTTKDSEKKFQ